MSDLILPVKNGVIEQINSSAKTEKTTNNELGKEAFLQLLVTQMKYQDPLNPSTDTEYIAQLATFSQLEQMQNIGAMTSNSQALSLVGKNVIVRTKSETGTINEIGGKVDFVHINKGRSQISINGNLYSIDDLYSVIDETYILDKGRPRILEKVDLVYDAEDPTDMSFAVHMGEGESTADDLAVLVDQALLDPSVITLKDNMVIIDKSVFENAPNGTYKVTVIFNDILLTTAKDMVTITIKNSEAIPEDPEEPEGLEGPEEPEGLEGPEEPEGLEGPEESGEPEGSDSEDS